MRASIDNRTTLLCAGISMFHVRCSDVYSVSAWIESGTYDHFGGLGRALAVVAAISIAITLHINNTRFVRYIGHLRRLAATARPLMKQMTPRHSISHSHGGDSVHLSLSTMMSVTDRSIY